MDLFEAVQRRRSVRAFEREAVEAEKVAQLLAAAHAAPSAGNLQEYEIHRVTREKERAALDRFFVAQAPVVLVFCANQMRSAAKCRERDAKLYAIQAATIACAFAMLAATALGLATVWVGAFDDVAVQRVLGCHHLLPVAILPVGYPAKEREPTPRRSLADLMHEGGRGGGAGKPDSRIEDGRGPKMKIEVACYSGYKGDERPVHFRLGGQDYLVEELLDQWYGPRSVFFKVRANDGNLYILRRDSSRTEGEWSLESFRDERRGG